MDQRVTAWKANRKRELPRAAWWVIGFALLAAAAPLLYGLLLVVLDIVRVYHQKMDYR